MNKQKWLIVGLSLAMAATLGVGISACGGDKDPDTPPTPTEHTHTYDAWDYNETQHWKYCDEHGTDKSNIDETTREDHIFTNGTCECGMKEADVTPDEDLDTRRFWVVGSGAGDLKNCSFTELKSSFMLTKQPKKDENGYTVYTTAVLTLYAGDTMKIVQDLDWDEGLGYFGVSNIKNNDGSLVDGGGPGNITPAKGKDGKYRFTVRTKPDIAFSQCTLEFKLIEPIEPLKNTEEIYIVGLLQYCDTKWPSGKDVTGCQKLDYDEETGEWSITLRLGRALGERGADEFKLFNAVNGAYIPDGTNNNKLVSGFEDRTDPASEKFYKASGDYKISWKKGDADITFTLLPHEHNFDENRMASDEIQHWVACWLDDTEKAGTRQNHDWENDQDTKCNTCGYTRHVHTYDQWGKNETQHWKQCAADGTIDDSTKENHVYDQPDGTCKCGQEQGAEACKHEGKINFTYTGDNVPAPQEAGGTLHGTCATCSEEVDVPYDKIGSIDTNPGSPSWTPSVMVEDDHTYYVTLNHTVVGTNTGVYCGYKIEKMGTLTLRINLVYGSDYADGNDLRLVFLSISETNEGPANTSFESKGDLILFKKGVNKWNTASKGYAKWKEQITFTPEMDETGNATFVSMTVIFQEEDVGKYMYMIVGSAKYNPNSSQGAKGNTFLVEATFSPAALAALVAPQEVAMLPGKED